jgi:hypothetical protein
MNHKSIKGMVAQRVKAREGRRGGIPGGKPIVVGLIKSTRLRTECWSDQIGALGPMSSIPWRSRDLASVCEAQMRRACSNVWGVLRHSGQAVLGQGLSYEVWAAR